jgi:FAD/FMN-containing dehydrogenase
MVRQFRGSISAEHGIGRLKRAALARHKGRVELDVMRAIKHALDPKGILNPGKVLPEPDTGRQILQGEA